MPADVRELIVKSDHKIVAAARRRGGEKAAKAMIERIAKRASQTRAERDQQREQEMADEVDRAWPASFLLRGKQ